MILEIQKYFWISRIIPMPENPGEGAQLWRAENWGTTPNSWGFQEIGRSGNTWRFKIETAYDVPVPVCHRLVDAFGLSLNLVSIHEGNKFAVRGEWKGGKNWVKRFSASADIEREVHGFHFYPEQPVYERIDAAIDAELNDLLIDEALSNAERLAISRVILNLAQARQLLQVNPQT
jgi:hypothetical protein